MAIVSCSLGCSGGTSGAQVNCGISTVAVNQEISIAFTQPVDLASVTKNSFQVANFVTGKTPPGSFLLDPQDPRRVIFRPQLTFDSSGNPVFGLVQGETYLLRIPGTSQDPVGPYIRSQGGAANNSRLDCLVSATFELLDLAPGPPSAVVSVDVVTGYDPQSGAPNAFDFDVPAANAVDVWRQSEITIVFDDVMNPATVANPVTGQSSTLRVWIDADGDPSSTLDQSPLFGTYSIGLDQSALSTTVRFKPASGLPSKGSGALPRKIVLELPAQVLDLGGNALANSGVLSFTPEFIAFPELLLPGGSGEDFSGTQLLDAKRTGAAWGNGALVPGAGGGAGQLGDLDLAAGTTLELDTDHEEFQQLAQLIPLGAAVPDPELGHTTLVQDGIFEFSSVTIRPGAVLRLVGSKPARVYTRGQFLLQGALDVGGRAAAPKLSWQGEGSAGFVAALSGEAGGTGGPGAGRGGRGGDRPDNTGSNLLELPGLARGVLNPGAQVDGQAGEGIGGAPAAQGGGSGGLHWPPTMPSSTTPPPIPTSNANFSGLIGLDPFCAVPMVAGCGAGAAYATSGGTGVPLAPLMIFVLPALWTPVNHLFPITPGADSSSIPDLLALKTLQPEAGLLRGGAGGGGGGAHVYGTRTSAQTGLECYTAPIVEFYSHSGGGGGGGGGALQVQAGGSYVQTGVLLASGGSGSTSPFPLSIAPEAQLAPGGGGSGGAVLLQSLSCTLSTLPGRIDVSGGVGGLGSNGSRGGDGGAGIVRIETPTPLDPLLEAAKFLPYQPSTPTYGGADSDVIFSTAAWTIANSGPAARSGATSCWIRPQGNFFELEFRADGPGPGDLGWDMQVLVNAAGLPPISWRDADDPNNPFGLSLEQLFGSDLGGTAASPIAVRFQGARAVKEFADPCTLNAFDPLGAVLPGSLTGWVRHPAELNDYYSYLPNGEGGKLRPNMIRFQVVFDRNTGLTPGALLGISGLGIRAQPD